MVSLCYENVLSSVCTRPALSLFAQDLTNLSQFSLTNGTGKAGLYFS